MDKLLENREALFDDDGVDAPALVPPSEKTPVSATGSHSHQGVKRSLCFDVVGADKRPRPEPTPEVLLLRSLSWAVEDRKNELSILLKRKEVLLKEYGRIRMLEDKARELKRKLQNVTDPNAPQNRWR